MSTEAKLRGRTKLPTFPVEGPKRFEGIRLAKPDQVIARVRKYAA